MNRTNGRCEPQAAVPGAALFHPVALLALSVWLANDHLFKAAWRGHLVTGKLSDVASLIVFPLILTATFEWVGFALERRVPARQILLASAAATAFVMFTINLHPTSAHVYEVGLGALQWPFHALAAYVGGAELPPMQLVQLWMDPSDLWTLPSALVPLWIHKQSRS